LTVNAFNARLAASLARINYSHSSPEIRDVDQVNRSTVLLETIALLSP